MRDAHDTQHKVPEGFSQSCMAALLEYLYHDCLSDKLDPPAVVQLLHAASYYGTPRYCGEIRQQHSSKPLFQGITNSLFPWLHDASKQSAVLGLSSQPGVCRVLLLLRLVLVIGCAAG